MFAKTIGDGGAMLAFGLWLFGLLVLRPVRGRVQKGLVLVQVAADGRCDRGHGGVHLGSLLSLPATPQGIDVGGFLWDAHRPAAHGTDVAGGRLTVIGLGLAAVRTGDRRALAISTVMGLAGGADSSSSP